MVCDDDDDDDNDDDKHDRDIQTEKYGNDRKKRLSIRGLCERLLLFFPFSALPYR